MRTIEKPEPLKPQASALTGSSVTPGSTTGAGNMFYDEARRILTQMDAAEQLVADVHHRPKEPFRISTTNALARRLLLPVLPDYFDANPGVEIQISACNDFVGLFETKVDIAIRVGQLESSSLIARKIANDRRVVCASPACLERHETPSTPHDLETHNCLRVSFNRAMNKWTFRGEGSPISLTVEGNLEADSSEIARDAALEGLGIIRLSTFMIGQDIIDGRLIPLLHRNVRQTVHSVLACLNQSSGTRLVTQITR